MNNEMRELLQYRYDRTVETLDVAKELFEIFPRTLGRKISMLALIREQSDYNDFYIASSAESQQQVEIAEELISYVAKYLRNQGIEL